MPLSPQQIDVLIEDFESAVTARTVSRYSRVVARSAIPDWQTLEQNYQMARKNLRVVMELKNANASEAAFAPAPKATATPIAGDSMTTDPSAAKTFRPFNPISEEQEIANAQERAKDRLEKLQREEKK